MAYLYLVSGEVTAKVKLGDVEDNVVETVSTMFNIKEGPIKFTAKALFSCQGLLQERFKEFLDGFFEGKEDKPEILEMHSRILSISNLGDMTAEEFNDLTEEALKTNENN